MKFTILLIALALFSQAAFSRTAQEDLVQDFPGYGNHNYDIYSGMLNVTRSGSRKIHYVLVESQNDPLNDPLVIWLNGGPGCSSLLGLVQENGPFMFEGNNPFFTNNEQYSWNKRYNVLYLEGPPGVGYSINNDPLTTYNYTEDNTGKDFTEALVQFRQRFANTLNINNDLWITGESYAGMYIPFFTKHILQYNKQNPGNSIPIKGFLIGNGVFINDDTLFDNTFTDQYVQNHFFNKQLSSDWEQCKKHGYLNLRCLKFQRANSNVMNNTDPYQIYNYTYSYQDGGDSKFSRFIREQVESRKSQETPFMQAMRDLYVSRGEMDADSDRVLTPDDIIHDYFNLEQVKKALHVEGTNKEWVECNHSQVGGRHYNKGHDSTHLYPSFFEAGLRIMIYSGNTDAVVPHQYTSYCINDLRHNYGVSLTEQGKWRQWYPEGSQQVGGMLQYYKTNTGSEFLYTMIRAAGHEVPEYQPQAAWHMLDQFIQNKPL